MPFFLLTYVAADRESGPARPVADRASVAVLEWDRESALGQLGPDRKRE